MAIKGSGDDGDIPHNKLLGQRRRLRREGILCVTRGIQGTKSSSHPPNGVTLFTRSWKPVCFLQAQPSSRDHGCEMTSLNIPIHPPSSSPVLDSPASHSSLPVGRSSGLRACPLTCVPS
ncbi:hypothetical protein HPP92_012312 [Vanilla planifolia]|uniref:Uncharacterized protein n=1 Tax=Vanilla planifolia TaxID=51239 RepID=A0A835R3G2_VANPL|nr:hypothetical protein HPP92_012312 [Vanilla planifolia]